MRQGRFRTAASGETEPSARSLSGAGSCAVDEGLSGAGTLKFCQAFRLWRVPLRLARNVGAPGVWQAPPPAPGASPENAPSAACAPSRCDADFRARSPDRQLHPLTISGDLSASTALGAAASAISASPTASTAAEHGPSLLDGFCRRSSGRRRDNVRFGRGLETSRRLRDASRSPLPASFAGARPPLGTPEGSAARRRRLLAEPTPARIVRPHPSSLSEAQRPNAMSRSALFETCSRLFFSARP